MRTRKKVKPDVDHIGKPPVAKFTKSNPCNKLMIWNCFRGKRGFVRVQIDVVYSIIGRNAPRYMLREGYASEFETRNVEYLRLTNRGEYWLYEKFSRLLKKHPEWREKANNLPTALGA